MSKDDVGVPYWKESEGRWRLHVQRNGVKKSFSCSTPGRKGRAECARKAREWVEGGASSRNPTVQKLFDEWLEDTKITVGEESYKQRESYGRNYILPAIGPKRISAITNDQQLQVIINDAYKRSKSGNPLSKKTLQNLRTVIVSFFAFARKNGCTTYRPESIVIPRNAEGVHKRILQPQDLAVLFNSDLTMPSRANLPYEGSPRHEWYIHAYRFAVLTGLRPGEIKGLKWTDITNDVIHIQRAINVSQKITQGKNANARRSFPLPELARKELERQRVMLSDANVTSDYIFCDRRGQAAKEETFRARLAAYCRYHGITVVTPYELRHTFISVMQDAPPELVKSVAGHSQSMDTFGVYGHPVEGRLDDMAARIDETVSRYIDSSDDTDVT